MFYTREFASTYKHMENEGVASGLEDLVSGKGSGMIGLIKEFATGVDQWGNEMRDPKHPAYQQMIEQIKSSYPELEPISFNAFQKSHMQNKTKAAALSIAGFNEAPAYMNQTPTESHVMQRFDKYVAPKTKEYQAVQRSKDIKELQQAYTRNDVGYDDLLEKAVKNYDMTGKEVATLQRRFNKEGDNFDMPTYLFSRLPPDQQKDLYQQMTPEEKERFRPHMARKLRRELSE
jgi:hypothetical protein